MRRWYWRSFIIFGYSSFCSGFLPKNFSTVIANVHDELVVKNFVQERDKKFLTSGSKNFEDRILINEEDDIFIWGVVTYVIHSVY